jgi:hypothetical protein
MKFQNPTTHPKPQPSLPTLRLDKLQCPREGVYVVEGVPAEHQVYPQPADLLRHLHRLAAALAEREREVERVLLVGVLEELANKPGTGDLGDVRLGEDLGQQVEVLVGEVRAEQVGFLNSVRLD